VMHGAGKWSNVLSKVKLVDQEWSKCKYTHRCILHWTVHGERWGWLLHHCMVDVTDPLCPSLEQAEDGSVAALKRCAHDFADQQMTSDKAGLSYLESVDINNYDSLAIRRLIVQ
jgi:hypothetical protein